MTRLLGNGRSCGGQLRPPTQPAWNPDMYARFSRKALPLDHRGREAELDVPRRRRGGPCHWVPQERACGARLQS